ncbi:MAG: oxygen-dependent coproporphyrinogen oxidase [Acidobacteriota bacterium]|nr:oxygen-dependent coproporphyrinogen oxidase [Blastocatellia bacterium]MDW8413511.1 oxygen-dependent coproporphyrinogen oxidase [Acidobacteriota bacterium]
MKDRAKEFFSATQDKICKTLEEVDGNKFREDMWEREGGGGGLTRVLFHGNVFEKAGVNFSAVYGVIPESLSKRIEVGTDGQFFATGISVVLHPYNPMVPTVHANFRYLERGDSAWFGGGLDLTPYYPYKADVIHFHKTLKATCDRHDPSYYPRFKKWCDDYFTIRHRNEMRGVGGIFFDYLLGDLEKLFAFVQDCAEAFLPAYLPILLRRKDETYDERMRHFQLIRRGRYVEFNLIYDRGTMFGLETKGRTESVFMSLPALAAWDYDYKPEPGSREEEAWSFFQPRDWLAEEI